MKNNLVLKDLYPIFPRLKRNYGDRKKGDIKGSVCVVKDGVRIPLVKLDAVENCKVTRIDVTNPSTFNLLLVYLEDTNGNN
jgi:hypothetical protein